MTAADPVPNTSAEEPEAPIAGEAATGTAADQAPGHSPDPAPADWLVVALITLLAGFVAVLGLVFLPLYVGSVPLPISALLGVAAMILAPRACFRLTGSLAAAAAPVLAWFVVSVWFVLKYNSVMPTVPLTVIAGQWRVMLLLGLGSLAAAATLGLLWADRLRRRMAAQGSEPTRSG